MEKRPLSRTHPRLAAEWHPTKNGRLRPNRITFGSDRPVWWRCRKGPDHEWRTPLSARTGKRSSNRCPFCQGQRISVTNSLATRFPTVAAQWHPTRNGRLRPTQVTAGSGRQVWWRCRKGPDHEWRATVGNRTNLESGCPFCAGLRVSVTNSLATRFPAIAAEWHPTKNDALTPKHITAGSGKRVWWRCRHDPEHAWLARPNLRTKPSDPLGCPFCRRRRATGEVTRSFAAVHPAVAIHWHPTKNGRLTVDQLARGSDRPVWWRCPANPSEPWQATLANWSGSERSCRFCVSRRVPPARSLAFRYPKLAAEWHPTKNGKLTPEDVWAVSSRSVWWRCRRVRSHVWAAIVANRAADSGSKSHGCPFCAYRKRAPDNSLAARFPTVAAQWHPTRNGSLQPDQVGASSMQRVWWRCPKGPDHVWEATILSRARGRTPSGCPFCARHQLSVTNSLATHFPAVAAQWHPTKNGALTPDQVGTGSEQPFWWQCPNGPDHVWQASIHRRTQRAHPSGCPFCAGLKVSVTNSLAARFPEFAAQWHPTKNGALTPDQVVAGSHRRVWWRCPRGPDHEWQTVIDWRTSQGHGCPACRGLQASVTNSLAARLPAVAAQWHPTKNGPLSPDQVVTGSSKKVWWRCPRDPRHEWRRRVGPMVRSRGCPVCARSPGGARTPR